MGVNQSGPTEEPSPSELARIVAACERFEAAWRRGERPNLEASLDVGGPEEPRFLERLLPLEISLRLAQGEIPAPEDYLSRFPGSRGVVEAAFVEITTAVEPSRGEPLSPTPVRSACDSKAGSRVGPSYNLLIGILALQNGFIDLRTLISAIQSWAADKDRRLGDVLTQMGELDARRLELLEMLAEEHRLRNGDDLHGSLASLGSLAPALRALEGMDDSDLENALAVESPTQADSDAPTTGLASEDGWVGRNLAAGVSPVGCGSASRFQILNFHNAGTLGKVFLALDKELNRNVALKEIQERQAHHPLSRAQFVLEGMVTGALEHPGIVPVYSLGEREDGSPFYAMRFIQGPSLRDKIRQLHGDPKARPLAEGDAPPTLPRLLRHYTSACQAIAYAHARGVLHRDLKPEHILLGPFGETLVVDWGLALTVARDDGIPGCQDESPQIAFDPATVLAQDGVVVGTLAYMSPEQAKGQVSLMDARSDVFALGAILYAILTGGAPYPHGDFADVLAKARRGDFPRPSAGRHEVPRALEAICMKAMAFEPSGRYATAGELAHDVERWLDDEPTMAYPEPWPVRAGRWIRRHRTTAAATAAALVCAVIGLAALNVQIGRANAAIRRQRDIADAARRQAVTAQVEAEGARGQAEKARGLAEAAGNQAEVARTEAEAARAEAEANFRESLDVVRNLMLPVAIQDLPRLPGTMLLRQRVAGEATRFLEGLWTRRPEDPEVRLRAAAGYRELANVLRLMGRPDGGAYRRAVDLLRGAVRTRPEEPRYRDRLAETMNDGASSLLVEGDIGAASPLLVEAAELTASLCDRHPDARDYRRTRARVCNNLASHKLMSGDLAEASRLAAEAAGTMSDYADGDAPGPTDALEAVMHLETLGDALLQEGREVEAEAALDEALERVEGLLKIAPKDGDLRFLKFSALVKRAEVVSLDGDRGGEAVAAIDVALIGFEGLTSEHPHVAHYKESLAEALVLRARLPGASEATQDSQARLAKARGLADGLLKESPRRPAYHSLLGRVHGRLGEQAARRGAHEEARANFERARRLLDVAHEATPKFPVVVKAREEVETALSRLLTGS